MNILIIDRVKLFQQIIASELDKHDINYVFESDADSALNLLNRTSFDMICTTLFLETTDGLGFCKQARKIKGYSDTPIILITSNHTPGIMEKALKSGITDIFDKQNYSKIIDFILGYSQQQPLTGKILYVEDTKSQRWLLTETLKKHGLTVNAFATGDSAWESFQQQHYDLVITDIILTGSMSGVSLASNIRHMKGDKSNTPIFALSAFEDSSRRIGLFSLGINDYIPKPINEKELITRIKKTFYHQKLLIELKTSQLKAEKANRAKSQFLYSMSHELRTPLNSIIGFAQLLDTGDEPPLTEEQTESVQHILKGGYHLLEIINDILDLAKVESGEVNLKFENTQITEFIDNSLSLIQQQANKNNISIHQDYQCDKRIAIHADKTRSSQILLNFISNAIKYNSEQGDVILKCHHVTSGMLRVSVIDTGKGIPVNKQNQLFKPFNRLGLETSEIEGTGIGLVVCKELAKQMNGFIGFESELGKGSTFWVELPFVKN